LIDDSLSQGIKSGYNFVWAGDGAVPSVSFIVTGTPQVVGGSGQRMFCSDQTGVIHYDPPAPAARPPASSCSNISNVACFLGLRRPPLSVLCPLGQGTGLLRLSFEQQNTGLTPYSSKFNYVAGREPGPTGSVLVQIWVPDRAAGPVRRWAILTALRLRRRACPECWLPGTHAKAEGLFSNRAASRRGGYFDHLRDSNSQLSSFPHACQ